MASIRVITKVIWASGSGSVGNGGKLAATGADWSFVGLLALLMLGAGAVVLRKKRRSQHS
jgi:LPXTG-motif cell wall-anchored protein